MSDTYLLMTPADHDGVVLTIVGPEGAVTVHAPYGHPIPLRFVAAGGDGEPLEIDSMDVDGSEDR